MSHNIELRALAKWFKPNKLILNLDNTNNIAFVTFYKLSLANHRTTTKLIDCLIDENLIKQVCAARFLGVNIILHVTCTEHNHGNHFPLKLLNNIWFPMLHF